MWVLQDCSTPTVMLAHDSEAFLQGGFVVLGGHALVQIVDDGQVGVVQRF